MLITSNSFLPNRLGSFVLKGMKNQPPYDVGLPKQLRYLARSWSSNVREKTSISGKKTGQTSNPGVSANTPDEPDGEGQVTTFPHSHSLSRNWVSKEY